MIRVRIWEVAIATLLCLGLGYVVGRTDQAARDDVRMTALDVRP